MPVNSRYVILHFHTYKNAGSTVDRLLSACFPGAWGSFDFLTVPEFFLSHSEISVIARNRPHLKAISSHQIRLPVPKTTGIQFLPIVLIRHPVLRLASIWRFERSRTDDGPATLIAKQNQLADWIRLRLKLTNPRAVCNNQAWMFSFGADTRTQPDDPDILVKATANLSRLPFIGVVEETERSLEIYTSLYGSKVPGFEFRQIKPINTTKPNIIGASEELDQVTDEIGSELFEMLIDLNDEDLFLYEFAKKRMSQLSRDVARFNVTPTDGGQGPNAPARAPS